MAGLFTPGTAKANVTKANAVAGADFNTFSTITNNSTSTKLYSGPTFASEWNGSGTYDVWLVIGTNYYKAINISFTSVSTPVMATVLQLQ